MPGPVRTEWGAAALELLLLLELLLPPSSMPPPPAAPEDSPSSPPPNTGANAELLLQLLLEVGIADATGAGAGALRAGTRVALGRGFFAAAAAAAGGAATEEAKDFEDAPVAALPMLSSDRAVSPKAASPMLLSPKTALGARGTGTRPYFDVLLALATGCRAGGRLGVCVGAWVRGRRAQGAPGKPKDGRFP